MIKVFEQRDGCFGANFWYARNIVRTVTDQAEIVDDLVGTDSESFDDTSEIRHTRCAARPPGHRVE